MEKSIILNFPPVISREEKTQISNLVNNCLHPISHEVNAWCGFVDVLRSEQQAYTLIAIADNEEVRDKMQDLLETVEINVVLSRA